MNQNYDNFIFNPMMIHKQQRNSILNQNIYQCCYANYKTCPRKNSIYFNFQEKYSPDKMSELPNIMVYHDHPIDVCERFTDKGFQSLYNFPCPAIVYPFGDLFNGNNFESGEGIFDDMLVLRTDFPAQIKRQRELFENDNIVVYTPIVNTIRDKKMNGMNHQQIFKFSVISIKQKVVEELLEDDDEQFMRSSDLTKLRRNIETSIHAAIAGQNNVLLFLYYPENFNIPYDDQILVLNYCLTKYAHMFKLVGICIPKYQDVQIYNYFQNNIIDPLKISKEIDHKYDSLKMVMNMNLNKDDTDSEKKDILNSKLKKSTKLKVKKKN